MSVSTFSKVNSSLVLLALGLLAAPIHAQEQSNAQPIDPDAAVSEFRFTLHGGYIHGFDSDLDGGGDVSISRFEDRAGLAWELTDNLDVSLGFNYVLDSYDFSTPNALDATEPWDDIHQMGFGAVFSYSINNHWSVFGGPVFEFAREDGADWTDGFTGGGVFGMTYAFSQDLVLGGGLGVVSQLEDDVRFIPIVIINWNITSELTLTSKTSGAFGGAAIELSFHADPWVFAIGGVRKFSRFRLDDDGVAPDGIGEEDSIPMYLRVGYEFNEQFSIDLYGGAATFGSLRLEDSGGGRISEEDFDAAPFVGVYLKVQF